MPRLAQPQRFPLPRQRRLAPASERHSALARYNSHGREHWESALKRILSSRQVRNTVESLAARIRVDYGDKRPVLVGVLKGAFVFLADLIREVNMPLEGGFI